MDNPTFFQTAMKSISVTCDRHDLRWQLRKRKISTWMIFRLLLNLIGASGLRETLVDFDLEKKAFLPPPLSPGLA